VTTPGVYPPWITDHSGCTTPLIVSTTIQIQTIEVETLHCRRTGRK